MTKFYASDAKKLLLKQVFLVLTKLLAAMFIRAELLLSLRAVKKQKNKKTIGLSELGNVLTWSI